MKNNASTLIEADLPLPLFIRGKVRDTFDLGDRLLIVATDRISAFDSVLPNGIPKKGLVLNRLSAFWFNETENLVSSHLVELIDDPGSLDAYLDGASRFAYPAYLAGRSMVVKKAERIPVECVVRGYLSGSAWAEYSQHGTVSGLPLPEGLQESQELPQPLFTPTTKAEAGHDHARGAVGRLQPIDRAVLAGKPAQALDDVRGINVEHVADEGAAGRMRDGVKAVTTGGHTDSLTPYPVICDAQD